MKAKSGVEKLSADRTPRDLLSAVYAAAGARDWDAVESLLHPDFVLYEAECLPFGGEWRGRGALQRCAAAMYGTWKEAKVDIHDITGGDTHAVTVLTLTMTPKDGSAPFSQTVNECGAFEDGLLKELRIHYFDAAEVAARA
ncbi:MAG: nuclear transport factor 2 family protein [Erythrobacter sp.]